MTTTDGGFKGLLEIEVANTEILNQIMENLKNLTEHIRKVERLNNFELNNFVPKAEKNGI
jgi:hypothetical protein